MIVDLLDIKIILLASILFLTLVIYNSFATYEVLKFSTANRDRRFRAIFIVWIIPVYGAYTAIKNSGFNVCQIPLEDGKQSIANYYSDENND